MTYEAVLFDIDDTLCRYRRSGDELLDVAFRSLDTEPFFTVADYHERYAAFVDDSDSIIDLREACFASIAAERGRDPALGREVAAAFNTERDHRDVEALPGALATVDALSNRPLAVVTNGAPEMQREKLDALGVSDAFDAVVYAGYETPAKPNSEPFFRALDSLEGAPDEAVHVGNSLRSDVAGAHAAGVGSVWLADGTTDPNPDPGSVPDHTIQSLSELPSLLEE